MVAWLQAMMAITAWEILENSISPDDDLETFNEM